MIAPNFAAYADLTQERFDRFQLEAFAAFDDKTSQNGSQKFCRHGDTSFMYPDRTAHIWCPGKQRFRWFRRGIFRWIPGRSVLRCGRLTNQIAPCS